MQISGYVLLIDDERDFLETLSFWLESKGYIVKSAIGGKEGLDRIASERPYLIFLDINMPVMDGIDVLKEIRMRDKNIPVIMLTAATSKERMQQAEALGISGFFPKQESLDSLVKLLDVTLRTHGKR
ncbi:MAG: response regulator [Candidatus Omnitrophica bacterium]|nr:response regulator [Candidatus Omnitrophota bacterium]